VRWLAGRCHRQAVPGAAQGGGEFVGGGGAPDVVALDDVAAQRAQLVEQCRGLDALGDDPQAEAGTEPDDAAHMIGLFFGWALVRALGDQGLTVFRVPYLTVGAIVVLPRSPGRCGASFTRPSARWSAPAATAPSRRLNRHRVFPPPVAGLRATNATGAGGFHGCSLGVPKTYGPRDAPWNPTRARPESPPCRGICLWPSRRHFPTAGQRPVHLAEAPWPQCERRMYDRQALEPRRYALGTSALTARPGRARTGSV
jgi:hypothetical protein